MKYDAEILYDRKRRVSARRRRELDHQTYIQTAREYWRFMDIDIMMSQSPNSRRGTNLSPGNAVNAEGKARRLWKGERGHRYPKTAKTQVVKNGKGQNVVVLTRADRDKKLQEKFGSIHT